MTNPIMDGEDCETIVGVLDGPDTWSPEARRLLAALVKFGPPGEGVVYRQPAEKDTEDKRDGMRARWTQEGAARSSALHTWKEVELMLAMAKAAAAREAAAKSTTPKAVAK